MTSTWIYAADFAQCIELVNKDNAGCLLYGVGEEVLLPALVVF